MKFFDDVVVREEIYVLYLKRMKLFEEVSKLEKIEEEYEKRAAKRANIFFNTAFMFFAAQFGISYYCIYEVDWLGWDLVEPLTYTLGQGMFVSGLIYSLRYIG